MTIEQKLATLERARKEGASPEQIERLSVTLWPPKSDVPEEAKAISAMAAQDAAEEKQHKLEKIVTKKLHEIGVPAHILGYRYLRTAILLCIEDVKNIEAVTKKLYPAVAKEYSTTSMRVERAIRHALEVAWSRGDVEVLNGYFGYTVDTRRGKPTNSEFIAMITDDIKMKIR